MKYKISNKAKYDIENIWLYTFENWSLKQADRYIDLIFDKIEYISKNPESGQNYNDLMNGYFCFKIKSHLIFYKIDSNIDEVYIIRILHQRMDIETRLIE